MRHRSLSVRKWAEGLKAIYVQMEWHVTLYSNMNYIIRDVVKLLKHRHRQMSVDERKPTHHN